MVFPNWGFITACSLINGCWWTDKQKWQLIVPIVHRDRVYVCTLGRRLEQGSACRCSCWYIFQHIINVTTTLTSSTIIQRSKSPVPKGAAPLARMFILGVHSARSRSGQSIASEPWPFVDYFVCCSHYHHQYKYVKVVIIFISIVITIIMIISKLLLPSLLLLAEKYYTQTRFIERWYSSFEILLDFIFKSKEISKLLSHLSVNLVCVFIFLSIYQFCNSLILLWLLVLLFLC